MGEALLMACHPKAPSAFLATFTDTLTPRKFALSCICGSLNVFGIVTYFMATVSTQQQKKKAIN